MTEQEPPKHKPAGEPAQNPPGPELKAIAQRQAEEMLEMAQTVADTRRDLSKLEGAVKRSETFAKWMDRRLLDPLVGAIAPELGDIATSLAGLYIVAEALNAGVPRGAILKMLKNLARDTALGLIPGLGDIADFFYRANKKNAKILRDYLEKLKAETPASGHASTT